MTLSAPLQYNTILLFRRNTTDIRFRTLLKSKMLNSSYSYKEKCVFLLEYKKKNFKHTSVLPRTSIVIVLGVRCRKTKPKLRAADTNADSSGLCAWYSSLDLSEVRNLKMEKISQKTHLPSLVSGITVWHSASNRKKLWACSSSDLTASISELSNHLNSGSYSGFHEKSIGSVVWWFFLAIKIYVQISFIQF